MSETKAVPIDELEDAYLAAKFERDESGELKHITSREKHLAGLKAVAEKIVPSYEMVNRFLRWPLPDSVRADDCATIQGYKDRSGTTLLTADEARQMLEYVLAAPQPTDATLDAQSRQARGDGLPGDAVAAHRMSLLNENLSAVDKFIEDYECDAGDDGYYLPTEDERALISDAIHGLHADDNFVRTFNAWQDNVRATHPPLGYPVSYGHERQDFPGGPIYRVGTSTGVSASEPNENAAGQEVVLSTSQSEDASTKTAPAASPLPLTMHERYGDHSDHKCCLLCGLCIDCGDCASKHGCGKPVSELDIERKVRLQCAKDSQVHLDRALEAEAKLARYEQASKELLEEPITYVPSVRFPGTMNEARGLQRLEFIKVIDYDALLPYAAALKVSCVEIREQQKEDFARAEKAEADQKALLADIEKLVEEAYKRDADLAAIKSMHNAALLDVARVVGERDKLRDELSKVKSEWYDDTKDSGEQIAELEADLSACRELLAVYNIGGMTDYEDGPMKRALKAEAALAAAKKGTT